MFLEVKSLTNKGNYIIILRSKMTVYDDIYDEVSDWLFEHLYYISVSYL